VTENEKKERKKERKKETKKENERERGVAYVVGSRGVGLLCRSVSQGLHRLQMRIENGFEFRPKRQVQAVEEGVQAVQPLLLHRAVVLSREKKREEENRREDVKEGDERKKKSEQKGESSKRYELVCVLGVLSVCLSVFVLCRLTR
jgi:hypothetical protein